MATYPVKLHETRNGQPTILVKLQDGIHSIHNEQNPLQEAKDLVENTKEQIKLHDRIVFFGMGLGYHIQEIKKKYPQKEIIVYEPVQEIERAFRMCWEDFTKIYQSWDHLIIEKDHKSAQQEITKLFMQSTKRTMYFILPSYPKLFPNEFSAFMENTIDILNKDKASLGATKNFSKRWTTNAIKNFNEVFHTPNFIENVASSIENNPVLLVAAGPSLNEEFENLRMIKEKKLAYIFAVGSANKSLLSVGIEPDAMFTYDPGKTNHTVFENHVKQNAFNTPMIFGSTVGYETLIGYKGPKFHFITSQDTIAPLLMPIALEHVIPDNVSIAIITMMILSKCKPSHIYLVGQDFGFTKDAYYAGEIQQPTLTHEDLYVEGTQGQNVQTSITLNIMRNQMEQFIEKNLKEIVTNTSTLGAKIEGAPFRYLQQIIADDFNTNTVHHEWKNTKQIGNRIFQEENYNQLLSSTNDFFENLSILNIFMKDLKNDAYKKSANKLLNSNNLFNEKLDNVMNNAFYKLVIYPTIRYEHQLLTKKMEDLMRRDIPFRTYGLMQAYEDYFNQCEELANELIIDLQNIKKSQTVD